MSVTHVLLGIVGDRIVTLKDGRVVSDLPSEGSRA